jgi:hypothetical protein
MSIDNHSFEIAEASPAPTGRPDAWTVTESAAEETFADYAVSGNPGDEGYPRETYEIGWPDLTQTMILSIDFTVDMFAIYDVGPSQQLFEDYENNWALPQGDFELNSIEYAVYGSADEETFSSGWGTTYGEFESADITLATYTSSSFDSFETNWKSNESSYVQGTSPTYSYAAFTYPATTYDYENFESTFSDGDIVYFYPYDEESALPSDLEEDTPYWIASSTASTFEIEAEEGSGSVDLTDVGNGTKMVKADKSIYWTEELTGV